jgi:hypothetical protein
MPYCCGLWQSQPHEENSGRIRFSGKQKKEGHLKRKRIAALLAAVLISAASLFAQNVITDWTTIASTAIVTNGGAAPGASGVWFAYASIAVYDAVNAVHRRKFEPFYYFGSAAPEASDEAAALAAARHVLVYYFPAQQTTLDAQFEASLSAVKSTPRAKREGVRAGEAAAEALISERRHGSGGGLLPHTQGTRGCQQHCFLRRRAYAHLRRCERLAL